MALSTELRASSTGSAFTWKYDVFLSFRGTDTRKGITDHLHKELERQGIRTFRDDPKLERGTPISPELLLAIEQSRSAIVVLSPNYATSTWCFFELCKIFECMEERGAILPIFYKVNPSHVRYQTGSFAKAFNKHKKEFEEDSKKVQGWRDALTKVANLAGWTSNDYRYETDLIKDVLLALRSKVDTTYTIFDSSEKLVGMNTKLEEMNVLLDRKTNDVRFIGIWGMGGIGKTTLARQVYEKFSHQFEVCIFVANVREVSTTHGLVYLQKQIISQILKEENVQVWDVYCGVTMIKRCLYKKAVLLVLDDVDQVEQMEKLVGEEDWFGLRSRILITTRYRHLLVTHGIEIPYELKGLNDDDALKLFSLKAFRKYEPEEDFAELSRCFVSYASGLPLALKTLGSFLNKRSPDAWISALEKLRNTPNRTVFDVLKVSYNGLDDKEKNFFLDIACFSSQCQAKFIIELLYSSDICTRITIDVLVERCLLTVSDDNEIGIHDLIQEMGCDIVREKSCHEPGGRSRLWLPKDIFHVFTKNTGTEAVEAIFLHLPKLEEANWNSEGFSKMCKLKMLYIHNLRLSHGPKYLSDALTFLNWSWYPSKSLPPSFQPDELTELSLVHSNVNHLWDDDETKYLAKLKSIDLSYSVKLRKTPDFTGIQNLEKLVLEGCTNLVDIHPSIAFLKRLKILNLRNCKSIKSFPSEVELESLETFDVSGCSKLQVIPEFLGQMNRLSKLSLSGTAVKKLPPSYEHLSESLVELDLCGIVIRELPSSPFLKQYLRLLSFGLFPRNSLHPLSPLLSSLKHLTSLTTLKLKNCNLGEGAIPDDIGSLSSLEKLDLRGNNFVTLPASIHLLLKLKEIVVENCKRLQQLPGLPSTEGLEVRMDNCTSLQVFPDLPASCSLLEFQLSCINCFNTVGDQDCCYFIYSVLKRLLEGTPCSFEEFSFVIPGGEIVEWFSNQSVGDSVAMKLPSYASNSYKWIGVAVCALFVPQDNPSAVPEDDYLDSDKNKIICTWDGSKVLSGFGSVVTQIVSDHLFIVVLSSHLWRPRNSLEDTCNEVKFAFETTQAVGNKRCIKVKQCAVRALYEHDMEELSRNSVYMEDTVDCGFEKSEYEQGGGIIKGTPEAAPSTSGGCEDEYYSAEE